jgi:hypothetical protein
MLMNTFWKGVLVRGIFFLQVQKDNNMVPFIHLHFKVKLKKIQKMLMCRWFKEKKCVIKEAKLKIQRKWRDLRIRKTWDFAFLLGLGPWTWDQVFHAMTHQVRRIILIIIPLGLDFHGTLPFLGTFEIGLWDIVWSAPK